MVITARYKGVAGTSHMPYSYLHVSIHPVDTALTRGAETVVVSAARWVPMTPVVVRSRPTGSSLRALGRPGIRLGAQSPARALGSRVIPCAARGIQPAPGGSSDMPKPRLRRASPAALRRAAFEAAPGLYTRPS
ncbi:hypothetical protein [Streptomyces sp. NPDC004976]